MAYQSRARRFTMDILDKINQSVIGKDALIETPYGFKPLVYADYTASGRSLSFIEDYMRQHVLPVYANTHSDSSFTGAQMNRFYRQSKQMIRDSVNAGENDRVVFCGAGATSAINTVVDLLGLRQDTAPGAERPIVFIGPYEHHSNELPWREANVDLCVIPLDDSGGICLSILNRKLKEYEDREYKIGSFSAASNVTGRLSDVAAITQALKAAGALSFWDYAAAGPYVSIDVNMPHAIDAIFLSPHKFIGGPGTCGVLVAKKHVFINQVPVRVGGGTVSYVTANDHDYVQDLEAREEGGTPAIVDAIRTGLVFKLKDQVGVTQIAAREHAIAKKVIDRLSSNENIELLGSRQANRLSIFSLRIRAADKYLHYGYIVTLLNDLFGIQTRGGCSCAGPYGHQLLGLDSVASDALRDRVNQGDTAHRPGWVRFNINYFVDEAQMLYILDAIELLANHAERLLNEYQCCLKRGLWRHKEQHHKLADLGWDSVAKQNGESLAFDGASAPVDYDLLIEQAKSVLESRGDQSPTQQTSDAWFLLPSQTVGG